jgi:diadenosine tetraphosphate (Ap4A) HIT family hydrolase
VTEQDGYRDLVQAGQAVEQAFGATKMSIKLPSNPVPHLHAHLVRSYDGDPAPGRPINPAELRITATLAEYEERVAHVREQLVRETDWSP